MFYAILVASGALCGVDLLFPEVGVDYTFEHVVAGLVDDILAYVTISVVKCKTDGAILLCLEEGIRGSSPTQLEGELDVGGEGVDRGLDLFHEGFLGPDRAGRWWLTNGSGLVKYLMVLSGHGGPEENILQDHLGPRDFLLEGDSGDMLSVVVNRSEDSGNGFGS